MDDDFIIMMMMMMMMILMMMMMMMMMMDDDGQSLIKRTPDLESESAWGLNQGNVEFAKRYAEHYHASDESEKAIWGRGSNCRSSSFSSLVTVPPSR